MIIAGDVTQIDLPYKVGSGLDEAIAILKGTNKNIAFCTFATNDTIRHPLVKTILKAYENIQKKHS
jgi:phosphate starvation-inducible PhoH-like protein